MNRRSFLSLAPAASFAAAKRPAPPNIVFFLSDDHGYWDSPSYGSKAIRTPNMDSLAREGTVFTNAYTATPACVPCRAALMSGLAPVRNGAEANHSGLKPGIKTMPSYLKELGYRVAHFGKGHFQPREAYPDMEFVPSEIKRGGLTSDLDPPAFDKWLSGASNRPLALFVNCHSPHVYWEQNQGYDPAKVELPPTFVDTPETREYRTRYYTDITKMDTQLGEILQSVRSRLNDNTLFIYAADNGAQWPFAKWSLYDAGIRMPMIARWPGVVKSGARSDAMLSFIDFLPTFTELGGGKPPADIDGRSFARVLWGETRRHRDRIYGHHSNDGDVNVYPCRCVRTERYKYILNLHPEFEYTTHIQLARAEDGKGYWTSWEQKASTDAKAAAIVQRYKVHPAEELYDVKKDPHETHNIAGDPKQSATLAALRKDLEDWMKAQGDARRVIGKPHLLSQK